MATVSVVAEYSDGYQFVAPLLGRSKSDRHNVRLISIGRFAVKLLTNKERCIGINKVLVHRKEEFNSLFSGSEDYFLLCMPQSDRGLAAIRQALAECCTRRRAGDEAKILFAVPPAIPIESAIDLWNEQICAIDFAVAEPRYVRQIRASCKIEPLAVGHKTSLSAILRKTNRAHAVP